jgi:hypothetical protein
MSETRYNLAVDSGQMAVCPVPAGFQPSKDKHVSSPVLRGAFEGKCDINVTTEKGRVTGVSIKFNPYGNRALRGEFVVSDPCYIYEDDFDLDGKATGLPYDSACRATNDTLEQAGAFPVDVGTHEVQGFASSTGWGDGVYPIDITTNPKGEVVKIEMLFDEEADDSTWEEDDDETE